MVKSFFICFVLLLSPLIVVSEECSFAPTAKITTTPVSGSSPDFVFRDGTEVVFSGATSTANNCNGSITEYRWKIEGVYYYGSTKTYTFPALGASEHRKTYSVELRVRNDASPNLYNTKTITVTVKRPQRIYHLKDHLGNVRTSVDTEGNVVGYDDYYPFGLSMPGRSNNTANPNDNYKFTGHERDDEAGLTLDYMGARNYDPIIGRFLQIDPLMEYSSPYVYVGNNPLNFTDPTGMSSCSDDYYNECGQYLGSDGASTNESRVIKQSEYDAISSANGGTTSAGATAALQNSSSVITIHEEQIDAVAQGVTTSSSGTGNEHSAYIVFDPENAQVFAIPGPTGDNGEVGMTYVDAGTGGPPLATDADGNSLGAIIFLTGQVHGHPKTNDPGMRNLGGTSAADKSAAQSSGATVYSIDAYSRRSIGRINRVTPVGVQDNNIGRVGSFKLGQDALRRTGGKN